MFFCNDSANPRQFLEISNQICLGVCIGSSGHVND